MATSSWITGTYVLSKIVVTNVLIKHLKLRLSSKPSSTEILTNQITWNLQIWGKIHDLRKFSTWDFFHETQVLTGCCGNLWPIRKNLVKIFAIISFVKHGVTVVAPLKVLIKALASCFLVPMYSDLMLLKMLHNASMFL